MIRRKLRAYLETGFVLLLFVASWVLLAALFSIGGNEGTPALEDLSSNGWEVSGPDQVAQDTGPVIWQDVDYTLGSNADWYPRNESPLLAELVARGELPHVDERVGEEPVVLKGVEGIGKYGGTWYSASTSFRRITGMLEDTMCGPNLLRWSPMGYPLVPHIAKEVEVNDGNREYVIHLRKGMRWSDGHPYTADDILFFVEREAYEPEVGMQNSPQNLLIYRGKRAEVEKLDDLTVRIRFDAPNGLFRERLATWRGLPFCNTPAHYLKQYHPVDGNSKVIETTMKRYGMPSRRALYFFMKDPHNTEHPRLWPWLFRGYKANPPLSFVRNPYYFAVDTNGNQLPYIDRLFFDQKQKDLIGVAAAHGEFSYQSTNIGFGQFTLLMSDRNRGGYKVRQWFPTGGGSFVICFNLNHRIEESKPESRLKKKYLNNKIFRRALSLAINRPAIIHSLYAGITEPSQAAPPPESPFFEPSLNHAYIKYDPSMANRLLDEIGLDKRDVDGLRTFPDGSSMHFFLDSPDHAAFPRGLLEFVAEDWAEVGVRVTPRQRAQRLFTLTYYSSLGDMLLGGGPIDFLPLINPQNYVPVLTSSFAPNYGKWMGRGGLFGSAEALLPGAEEPPPEHPVRRAMELYDEALQKSSLLEQVEIFREVLKIAADNLWSINISTPAPVLAVVSNDMKNVPHRMRAGWEFLSPSNAGVETFYFSRSRDSPGAIKQIQRDILDPTPIYGKSEDSQTRVGDGGSNGGRIIAWMIKFLFIAIIAGLVLMVCFRHPFVVRRIVLIVPTLLVISVLIFVVIELPPGDLLDTYIANVEESGRITGEQEIQDIKEMFLLDEPAYYRYLHWFGFRWFLTFKGEDRGLLQGNLGRSMYNFSSVNDLVGDRLLLTLCIGLSTVLFTWLMALPIGTYSAVRQYSLGDYFASLIVFFGMSMPNFLLALLLMYAGTKFFGIQVTGLFSPEFAGQPEWTISKAKDLLMHLWLPVLVVGIGGTGQMIRIMRANLLDELKKPYVMTARAKGVRPIKLILKYPVRLALNPFVSGLGTLFPQLISGGTIVALVLSLPTVGPLLLEGLMREDMYLAGSMLLILSLLSVVGTLISDLLLLALDPRIRMEETGSR